MPDTVSAPRKGAMYLKKLARHLLESETEVEKEFPPNNEILQESLNLINKMEALVRKSVSLAAASKYIKNPVPSKENGFQNLTDSGKASLTNQSVVNALMELKESQANSAQKAGRLPNQDQVEFKFADLKNLPIA